MKPIRLIAIICIALLALAGLPSVASAGVFGKKITTQDVAAAQQEWGDGIVAIAKVYSVVRQRKVVLVKYLCRMARL